MMNKTIFFPFSFPRALFEAWSNINVPKPTSLCVVSDLMKDRFPRTWSPYFLFSELKLINSYMNKTYGKAIDFLHGLCESSESFFFFFFCELGFSNSNMSLLLLSSFFVSNLFLHHSKTTADDGFLCCFSAFVSVAAMFDIFNFEKTEHCVETLT